ncbi:MAG: ATP-dependent dethiobiotin synthetase BioD [Acidimicrobiia bacterium]
MTGSTGPRPARLVVVAGTGTGVGKTWAAARLLVEARARGLVVAARKPVQSHDEDAAPEGTDAAVLAAASGEPDAGVVCPAHRDYARPLAPPMAAAVLGRPSIGLDDLVAETTWPEGVDLGVVETVGGVRSPVADDGDSGDLARRLAPDGVVLVADAELGTINATRLSVEALAPLPVVVLLNRFDPEIDLHRRNRAWLADRDGLIVVVDPTDLLLTLS